MAISLHLATLEIISTRQSIALQTPSKNVAIVHYTTVQIAVALTVFPNAISIPRLVYLFCTVSRVGLYKIRVC